MKKVNENEKNFSAYPLFSSINSSKRFNARTNEFLDKRSLSPPYFRSTLPISSFNSSHVIFSQVHTLSILCVYAHTPPRREFPTYHRKIGRQKYSHPSGTRGLYAGIRCDEATIIGVRRYAKRVDENRSRTAASVRRRMDFIAKNFTRAVRGIAFPLFNGRKMKNARDNPCVRIFFLAKN